MNTPKHIPRWLRHQITTYSSSVSFGVLVCGRDFEAALQQTTPSGFMNTGTLAEILANQKHRKRDTVMTWEIILDKAKKFKKSNRNVWFRGQGDSNWQLKSSLFRQSFSTLEQYLNNERTKYNLFKNLGHMYHNEDDWSLLYTMQHHGVKTRLLDWSESFATALFFASSNWENDNPITIWMLNPLKLNHKTLGSAHFFTTHDQIYREKLKKGSDNRFPNNSIALHPLRNNSRIVAQQGVFTIQGNTLEPLDKEFNGELITTGILERIDIEIKYREDVYSFLELSGVHPFSIYPDLEGLAKYISKKTDSV